MVSIPNIILIGIGVAAVLGVAAFYTYNLLNEDSPVGERARAQLGLGKSPGAGLLQDPRFANYTVDPRYGGYVNVTKKTIEDKSLPQYTRDLFKDLEQRRAERYFGKANAGFIVPTFSSKQVDR